MTVSADDAAHLRRSFDALRPQVEDASVAFYERLFERAPHLRPLFRDDIADQGMRFMTAVNLIVDRLDAGEDSAAYLARLGRGHAAVGVRPADFEPMREALIETFRDTLGPAFGAGAEAAWRRAFDEIAAAMVEAGAPR